MPLFPHFSYRHCKYDETAIARTFGLGSTYGNLKSTTITLLGFVPSETWRKNGNKTRERKEKDACVKFTTKFISSWLLISSADRCYSWFIRRLSRYWASWSTVGLFIWECTSSLRAIKHDLQRSRVDPKEPFPEKLVQSVASHIRRVTLAVTVPLADSCFLRRMTARWKSTTSSILPLHIQWGWAYLTHS